MMRNDEVPDSQVSLKRGGGLEAKIDEKNRCTIQNKRNHQTIFVLMRYCVVK